MPCTITRPMNSHTLDPFEIILDNDDYEQVSLHSPDRFQSDKLLIALHAYLSAFTIRRNKRR